MTIENVDQKLQINDGEKEGKELYICMFSFYIIIKDQDIIPM